MINLYLLLSHFSFHVIFTCAFFSFFIFSHDCVKLDCKSGKCIRRIDPGNHSRPYISCMALDESESWLVRTHAIKMLFFPYSECIKNTLACLFAQALR